MSRLAVELRHRCIRATKREATCKIIEAKPLFVGQMEGARGMAPFSVIADNGYYVYFLEVMAIGRRLTSYCHFD